MHGSIPNELIVLWLTLLVVAILVVSVGYLAMWLLSVAGVAKNEPPDGVVARYYHFKRRFLLRALIGTVLCWPGLQWAHEQLGGVM
ncbi:hypothetical protein CHH28_14705 [Bacterioplanes sanyensis]|uniref:Uncharacterized protein n=1 Tax=Bacterioplanes sanyensis TaxID=1249553 RepID=A0A222FLE5_9GAMM|nr:hypothetical protein [Bacterioplanes sanyensis]ASP39847.1 hypothetical protein CHH28_14705 [Bacterioplanes sanyensis]